MNYKLASISQALLDIKKGKLVIIVDNPTRENEGDFFIPADLITKDEVMTMIRFGGGLVCVAITPEICHRLGFPLMVSTMENTEITKVNFTVSVNVKHEITSGISAFDRVKTIKAIANPKSKFEDFTIPGHVFGLVAAQKGLLERNGHTEAAVTLSKLAGFSPCGVICEIIKDDGQTAKLPDLIKIAKKLDIKIISIDDLTEFIKENPVEFLKQRSSVVKTASAKLPTPYGEFKISVYKSLFDAREHVSLLLGNPKSSVLTRIHSECLTGDTFHSFKCDCHDQLHKSLKIVKDKKEGLILYLNQEGRGIGLTNKIKSYALQEKGLDTVDANNALGLPADVRDYLVAADILKDLGFSKIDLLTNNPDKISQLTKYGIQVNSRVPIEIAPNSLNKKYLQTKKNKLKQELELV